MTNKSLSPEFIKTLMQKAQAKLPNNRVFSDDEHKLIRECVSNSDVDKFIIREREFTIRRFRFRNEPWITVRPVTGFVPMFCMSVKDFLKKETEV